MSYSEYLFAVLLGIVQGITEWLPISSSAHLILLQKYILGKTSTIVVALAHLGTLLAMLFIYRTEVFEIVKQFILGGENRKFAYKIIIGSVPIILVGLMYHNYIKSYYSISSTLFLSICFAITAAFLFLTAFCRIKRENITTTDAIIIGLVQVLSLFPGISRSGVTISTAIILGIDRKKAMLFSIYLSGVAILGACTLEIYEEGMNLAINPIISLIVLFVSFVFGLIALIILRKFTIKNKLHLFGIYCVFIAIIILLL